MTSPALDIPTQSGVVRGLLDGELRAWRGIPFAAPPVGDLRFRAPQPPAAWDGIRDATTFGLVAAQDRKGPFGGAKRSTPTGEDCLTINVTSPADASAESALPVMVFVHGGAYSVGAPPDVPFRGANFVRRGAVHVTFNYRLNAFGYLDFSEFGFDNNLGPRDQVAALEWVRDNIAGFGGDPSNVTLYGESSGGNAVTTLMTTPSSRGLFARAIAQSPPSNAVYWPHDTRQWAREFMTILGVPAGGEAEALRTRPTHELVTAARLLFAEIPDTYPGDQAFSPVVDGEFLPQHPVEAFEAGNAHPVPLIIGTNDREGTVFTGRRRILATTPTRRNGLLGATPPEGRALFEQAYFLKSKRGALDFGGDFAFWFPARRIAELHSAVAPSWLYRFDYAPPLMKALRFDATHGADLLTVFGRTRSWVGRLTTLFGGARDFEAVSERMQQRWFRFATDGTVDASWPRYDAARRSSLAFDREDHVELDARADRRRAWDTWVPLHSSGETHPAGDEAAGLSGSAAPA